jgi:hypothetical protein
MQLVSLSFLSWKTREITSYHSLSIAALVMTFAMLSIHPMRSSVGDPFPKTVLKAHFMRLGTSGLRPSVAAGSTDPTYDGTALAQMASQVPIADGQQGASVKHRGMARTSTSASARCLRCSLVRAP